MSKFQNHQKPPIILISECFVKPKFEIEPEKNPYHIGPVDIAMLGIDPIQKGLLFKLDQIDRTPKITHLLENLKNSLSIALIHFYPLAGRFTTRKHFEDNTSSIFIDCNKGPGVRLIHATALGLSWSDIRSPVDVTITRPFFDLGEKWVNHDGHTKALFSIQVTELLDGVFIGFSMSHSVVDGTSFDHFINMLSEIFRSCDKSNVTQISRVPVFNYRPWLISDETCTNNKSGNIKLPYVNIEELINRAYDPGPLRERIFYFSRDSILKLKDKVNQECGSGYVISSFLALSVFVWRSIVQARNLGLDEDTTCFMVIGARGRFDPPVSDDYFGNYISKTRWGCKVEELLVNDLGWAAMNLQKLVKAQDEKEILGMYKQLFGENALFISRGSGSESSDLHGENSVIMGGSARFDMYGPEFGLGRALAARMGYGNKEDGKVTANPGSEDDGSVDLEICLRPHSMAALEANQEFMSYVSL